MRGSWSDGWDLESTSQLTEITPIKTSFLPSKIPGNKNGDPFISRNLLVPSYAPLVFANGSAGLSIILGKHICEFIPPLHSICTSNFRFVQRLSTGRVALRNQEGKHDISILHMPRLPTREGMNSPLSFFSFCFFLKEILFTKSDMYFIPNDFYFF